MNPTELRIGDKFRFNHVQFSHEVIGILPVKDKICIIYESTWSNPSNGESRMVGVYGEYADSTDWQKAMKLD